MRLLFPILVLCMAAILLLPRFDSKPEQPEWQGRLLPALHATPLDKMEAEPIVIQGLTLINLFASWCPPCLAEHPQLRTLAEDHDLTIIGIAWNDTPDALVAYMRDHGNPYAAVYIDHTGGTASSLHVKGIPESFLVGPDGRILYHFAGPLDAERVRRDVLPLLERSHEP